MSDSKKLSADELARYRQQIRLPEIGLDGQLKLKRGKVAIIGLGGLGSPVALYLAAAGVGSLTLIDHDTISESNLHRQILFGVSDVGRPKSEVALERLSAINPSVIIETHNLRLDSSNAKEILAGHDLIIDCTDSFESRYAINAVAVALGIPVVFGSIYRFEGQVSLFGALSGPCYQCIYPEAPIGALNCDDDGVLGVLPGVIGMLQATEALKLLLRIGEPLIGKLLLYDALRAEFRTINIERNAECPTCGGLSKPEALPHTKRRYSELNVEDYADWLRLEKRHQLIDVREEYERDIASMGGELIPTGEIIARLQEISMSEPVVIYCHLGIRSREVATMLANLGYDNVYDLVGGIDRWSECIDRKVPRY
jgi:molybdopterin/thiamine biosynthesis adenylyltransferase/rhodanese-related sulfurtransferase